MKTEDIERCRRALVAQREQIMLRAGKRFDTNESSVGADGVPDFADYADEKARTEVRDFVAGSEDKLLEKIELALGRIEEGNYHLCADCGGHIPVARLRAKPAVSLCVDCQSKKEQAESGAS